MVSLEKVVRYGYYNYDLATNNINPINIKNPSLDKRIVSALSHSEYDSHISFKGWGYLADYGDPKILLTSDSNQYVIKPNFYNRCDIAKRYNSNDCKIAFKALVNKSELQPGRYELKLLYQKGKDNLVNMSKRSFSVK